MYHVDKNLSCVLAEITNNLNLTRENILHQRDELMRRIVTADQAPAARCSKTGKDGWIGVGC